MPQYTIVHYKELIPFISGFTKISTDTLAKRTFRAPAVAGRRADSNGN